VAELRTLFTADPSIIRARLTDMTLSLYARYGFPAAGGPYPVCVLMHGFSDGVDFSLGSIDRIAGYGLFVVAVAMRGRNASTGTPDCSGREIYDIYDAVQWARSTFPTKASASLACIAGYSGGGGNALAAACKMPDTWTVVADHFGMSDYGYDDIYGWYNQEGGARQAVLRTWVGDAPAAYREAYQARNAVEAITNYSGGHLYLFHDMLDGVAVSHSQRVGAAMLAAGMSNYTESYTNVGDPVRWIHGYPDGVPLSLTEAYWATAALLATAWTVPATGTHRIIGWIKNKRYQCWLRKNGTTTWGLDAVATVAYGATPNLYSVTPVSGTAIDVTITQADGKTGSATNISAATDITVS
jgi:hypothetical protein